MALSSIPVHNAKQIASQDHGDALKWIAVPRHGFAGSKTQTHHRGFIVEENFVSHF